MKISELITKLQKSLEKYGDLEVVEQCAGFDPFEGPILIIKSSDRFEKERCGNKMCYVGDRDVKDSQIIDEI